MYSGVKMFNNLIYVWLLLFYNGKVRRLKDVFFYVFVSICVSMCVCGYVGGHGCIDGAGRGWGEAGRGGHNRG